VSLDGERRVSIDVAAVRQGPDERPKHSLGSAQPGARQSRDVFEEEKPPARFQHPVNLPQRAGDIRYRTEHERAHHRIYTLVVDLEATRPPVAYVDREARS